MAIEAVRIRQAPDRFRLRLGQRVAVIDSRGYADDEQRGVIVDGVHEGTAGGGAYREIYEVRRADGMRFRAEGIALIRLYDDTELLEHIREQIRTFRLTRALPEGPSGDEELEGHERVDSAPAGSTCSACGHRIHPRDTGARAYQHDTGPVYFDSRCHAVWWEERKRPRTR